MSKLSKSDQRQVNTISLYVNSGNTQSAVQLAKSFIRSAASNAVQVKRIAGLATIGIQINLNKGV